MDPLKEAFSKVKQDILNLHTELSVIKQELQEIKRTLDRQTNRQTLRHINPTQEQENKTFDTSSTHSSTDNLPLEDVKSPISDISTGNQGVSTDRQTDRQTDTSTRNQGVKVRFNQEIDHLSKVSEIINSLDDMKKALRSQIKKLTNQEMAVFSTLYQLEEEGFKVDYSLISKRFSLSESSIRDYIQRIINKGIPIQKFKENNKKVTLSLPPEFKKIASLSTILQLREL